MAGGDINGFVWKIGWSPWLTTLGVTVLAIIVGAVVKAIAPLAGVGLLLGVGIYFYGTRVINANYEHLLDQFISETERGAARDIDVANSSTYSLTWGVTSSPIFVEPWKVYKTTTLVVTGTSVNINQGAKYTMSSRAKKAGGTNREFFYDQITAVESHQDGTHSTLELRTSGGESIEVGSGATDTVDAAISEIRKRLRDVKSGRNQSMGQAVDQQAQEQADNVSPEADDGTGDRESASGDSTGGGDASPEAECASCGESVAADAAFCPACGVESPLEATVPDESAAASADAEAAATSPAVADVAERLEDRLNPESSASRQLCRVLSDPGASDDEIQSAMEEAIDQLDAASAVEDAVQPADRRATTDVFEDVKQDLAGQRGRLPAAVELLVDQLLDAKRELEHQEDSHSDLAEPMATICRVAERSEAVSFEHRDIDERAEELATALQTDDVTIAGQGVSVPAVADDVDRRVRPTSEEARELLAELREPEGEAALSETITEVVSVLDDYGETREMLADISVTDVTRRLESLERELQSQDTAVHSRLATRVRELTSMVEDGSVDDIQLYAVYQEVSFYDRTLLPGLDQSGSAGGSADTAQLQSTVARRIEAIENDYVSVRADHNHSIPRHFLTLTEELAAEADEAMASDPDRAAGLLLAADSLLDHIEALYERNEYSVMLRRLRG
ncbi:hypothetical protein [Haloarcula sediminis]|uniref:hypothetical protein n=1 Tax=Haloarcula sediminis TaxID=3111777 RepID=UPI002D7A1E56|nr:hypothetical protein [Haloarcula sp. CK38]